MTRLDPVHPGEVLKHDFMEPFALSSTALAKAIGVTPARINEIVRCRRGITAETALRLAPKQASRVRGASFGCASCHRADLAASTGLFCRLARG